MITGWEQSASGYAAVWATENTRESLFDAMQRKEVYATTGPRMVVRFFGGWNYAAADAEGDLAAAGYAKGVPMGGDLVPGAGGGAPTFLVAAMKDPYGGNLDRIACAQGATAWRVPGVGGVRQRVHGTRRQPRRIPHRQGRMEADGKGHASGSAVADRKHA